MSDKEQPLSDLIGAPLVLFMPPEAIAGLALQKKQLDPWALQVWVQQPNALDEALLTALRCLSPHLLWHSSKSEGGGAAAAVHGARGHCWADPAPETA